MVHNLQIKPHLTVIIFENLFIKKYLEDTCRMIDVSMSLCIITKKLAKKRFIQTLIRQVQCA